MAPFTFGPCPRCAAETRQRWFLDRGAGGEVGFICEACYAVLTYRGDEPALCREATGDERALVPPPVVWSDREWAEYREAMRQGMADARAWFRAGCPGLTPELEAAFPPGRLDQVRRLIESSGDVIGPMRPAAPGAAPDPAGL